MMMMIDDEETIHSASTTSSSRSTGSAKLQEVTRRAELKIKVQQLKKKAEKETQIAAREEGIAIEEVMMISQKKIKNV